MGQEVSIPMDENGTRVRTVRKFNHEDAFLLARARLYRRMPQSERDRFFNRPLTPEVHMDTPPRTDGAEFHDPSLMHNSPRYVSRSRSVPAQPSSRQNRRVQTSRHTVQVMDSSLPGSFQGSMEAQGRSSVSNGQHERLQSPGGSTRGNGLTSSAHDNISANNWNGNL
ncbi:hypothetical protein BDD12DRAFT_807134 [Trichophaea hybrida]|nr:hypothetical protein BDD12DRAFT_807134 [Trichophaea hybrida]